MRCKDKRIWTLKKQLGETEVVRVKCHEECKRICLRREQVIPPPAESSEVHFPFTNVLQCIIFQTRLLSMVVIHRLNHMCP